MKMLSKLIRVIKRPARLLIGVQLRYAYAFNDQKALLRALYWLSMHKHLNLNNPKTFTEKTQWLKLYDHNPLYHVMVDKSLVKDYVSKIIGNEYIIPTYGVWDTFDEIDFDQLPSQFVIKTTNGGGNTGVVICKNKETFNKEIAKQKLYASSQNDIYLNSGEWSYKGIIPRYIVEEYMEDKNSNSLSDYKIWCFGGEPKILFYATDRVNAKGEKAKFDYYDMNFNKLPVRSEGHQQSTALLKPFPNFELMKELARKLSIGIPFVRVDFYNINGKVYFGELTFYHDSGFVPFIPQEWDVIFGDMIVLPKKRV